MSNESNPDSVVFPFKALFHTPMYNRALELCWDISSYQSQVRPTVLSRPFYARYFYSYLVSFMLKYGVSPSCFQTGLVMELLRLQKENLIPSQVTAEDMINFIFDQRNNTLRKR